VGSIRVRHRWRICYSSSARPAFAAVPWGPRFAGEQVGSTSVPQIRGDYTTVLGWWKDNVTSHLIPSMV
jgi:hypothetical protein